MKDSTRALHSAIIRAIKGILAAWEKWLTEQADPKDEK